MVLFMSFPPNSSLLMPRAHRRPSHLMTLSALASWPICLCSSQRTIPAHFRFWIFDFRLSERESKTRIRNRVSMCFLPQSKIGNRKSKMSSYDFVRPSQHVRRNRDPDLLRCLQVDDELKFCRLLNWKISRLGAFQDFVYVGGGAAEQVRKTHSVKHQTTRVDKLAVWIDCWEPVLRREVHDPLLIHANDGHGGCSKSLGAFL